MTAAQPRPHTPPPPAEPCGVVLPFAGGYHKTDPVPGMTPPEKLRCRAAASKARRLLPGPLGEYVGRELDTYADIGMTLGPSALVRLMVDQIMATPIVTVTPDGDTLAPTTPKLRIRSIPAVVSPR